MCTLPVIQCSQLPAAFRHSTHNLFLIAGDFNHAPPSSMLPTFTQYVTCPTRDNKTLDLFYANSSHPAELITTLSIYSLCINLLCTSSLWSPRW